MQSTQAQLTYNILYGNSNLNHMYIYKYIFYLYEKHQSPCASDCLSALSNVSLIYKEIGKRCSSITCVYVCLRVYQAIFVIDQIGSLRHVVASISYNTGKYIFLCKKNNHAP